MAHKTPGQSDEEGVVECHLADPPKGEGLVVHAQDASCFLLVPVPRDREAFGTIPIDRDRVDVTIECDRLELAEIGDRWRSWEILT